MRRSRVTSGSLARCWHSSVLEMNRPITDLQQEDQGASALEFSSHSAVLRCVCVSPQMVSDVQSYETLFFFVCV